MSTIATPFTRTSRARLCTTPQLRRQTDSYHDVLCELRRVYADRVRRRLAQRLALQLARAHGIHWLETSLVPWLVREHCADNGAALVCWVLQKLGACDSQPSATEGGEGRLLATLSSSLGRLLADVADLQP